jgi:hypothetical protein
VFEITVGMIGIFVAFVFAALVIIGMVVLETVFGVFRDLTRKHQWVAVPPDGPQEEGGVCKRCGALAASQQHYPCR